MTRTIDYRTAATGTTTQVGDTSPLPVAPPSEYPAFVGASIIRDLTTTVQTINLPSGAKWLHVTYRLLPGATAVTNQFAKTVINATSDADASGKLAVDGANFPLFQGDDMTFTAVTGTPITRIDVVTEQAVGAEKTVLRFIWGV